MLLFFKKKEQKSAFINFYKGNKLQKMKQRIFYATSIFILFWKLTVF